jgi:hypothetical protein
MAHTLAARLNNAKDAAWDRRHHRTALRYSLFKTVRAAIGAHESLDDSA